MFRVDEVSLIVPRRVRLAIAMTGQESIMIGVFDHRLVVLSLLISILGSYAGRDLFERGARARGRKGILSLICGAAADGIGNWLMHYTGMMALSLPIPILYHWPTVLLALFVGIVGSGAARLILTGSRIGWLRIVSASISLGVVATSGLHYVAMASMQVQAIHHYSAALVVLSVAIAVLICLLSFWLAFFVRKGDRLRCHGVVWLRAAANPAVHYTAMAGVTFAATIPHVDQTRTVHSFDLAAMIIVIILLFIVVVLNAAASEKKKRVVLDELFDDAIGSQARQFRDRTGIDVHCASTLEKLNLNREQSTAAFRIFHEALTNILRHAKATRVNVQTKEENGEFIMTIADNGRGITEDEKSCQGALGLLGMRERAHLVGGKIEIAGFEGKGTLVTVRIPVGPQEYSKAS